MLDAQRLWSSAVPFGDDFNGSPCMYLPNKPERTGYVSVGGGSNKRPAHRFMYEAFVGPIPEGMDIDHLCHSAAVVSGSCAGGSGCAHRACVNFEHLAPATKAENNLRGLGPAALNARKRLCSRGHPLSGANIGRGFQGRRFCKACDDITDAAWKKANPEKVLSYSRAYRERNRAAILAAARESYWRNREKETARMRAYYAKKRAAILAGSASTEVAQ